MTFSRTEDYALVRRILTDPPCWRRIVNDAAPTAEQFQVERVTGMDFILAEAHGKPCGLFLIDGNELHVCICPSHWGLSEAIVHAFLKWVWANYTHATLTAKVPGYNRLALRLALKAGFTIVRHQPEAVTKRGKLYDLTLLVILRPQQP